MSGIAKANAAAISEVMLEKIVRKAANYAVCCLVFHYEFDGFEDAYASAPNFILPAMRLMTIKSFAGSNDPPVTSVP